MSLLTEQEITEIVREAARGSATRRDGSTSQRIARAIESAVIEKIKAQGPEAWLHRDRSESDVVTTKFKHVWGEAVVGSLAMYDTPLYRLPEGEKE